MNVLGKTSIHPVLFYTGKISGYFTWIYFLFQLTGKGIIRSLSLLNNEFAAVLVMIVALSIVIISLLNLGKSTRLGLPDESTQFKTNGLYKFSRNPMYVGFNLLTISAILYTLNIYILLAGLYSIIIYHFIIIAEEQFLNKRFGKLYLEYKKKIRRYI